MPEFSVRFIHTTRRIGYQTVIAESQTDAVLKAKATDGIGWDEPVETTSIEVTDLTMEDPW